MKLLVTALTLLGLLISGCTSSTPAKPDEVSVYYYGNRSGSGSGSGTGSGNDGAGSQAIATARPAAVSAVVPTDGQGPPGVPTIVYFDYDSFVVKPEFQSIVAAHSKFLIANPDRKVLLEGHTDQRGGSEYNLALGQKRAEAVRKSLTLQGTADGQLEPVSLGKEKPASTEASEKGYALNRRVEFRYR
ncbi:MAG: OmpA family protein [Pseudomonadota bacterium]